MSLIILGVGIVGVLFALDYRKKWLEGKKETQRVKAIHEKFLKETAEKKKK